MTTRMIAVALAAGAATSLSAFAGPEKETAKPTPSTVEPMRIGPSASPERLHQAKLRGHVRIKLATGERTITLFDRPGSGGTTREGPLMYENTDIEGSFNYFFDLDNPDLQPPLLQYEALDWGDFSPETGATPCVDGFSFAYAGDGRMGLDPTGEGVEGLNAVIRFYQNDNGFNTLSAVPLVEIEIQDLPGHDGLPPVPPAQYNFQGWAVTIDLEGTEGAFTIDGIDMDFDTLRDISWSYQFDQQQAGGPAIMGPFLVRPASLGGLGNATGVEDGFDEFSLAPRQGYTGTWSFGGGGNPDPNNPGGFLPYASFYMELYGDVSGPCPPVSTCYPNCDQSTTEPILNVDDFTCFINDYAASTVLPHEQQVEAYSNCDGSTVAPALNVDDFTCFINSFAAGCS